jgi:hypothetical protein
MIAFLRLFLHVLVSPFKTQAQLESEIVLLRHQLNVLRQRFPSKPKLSESDRLLFVWLYRLFPSLLAAITIVQPETIIRWHRTGLPILEPTGQGACRPGELYRYHGGPLRIGASRSAPPQGGDGSGRRYAGVQQGDAYRRGQYQSSLSPEIKALAFIMAL